MADIDDIINTLIAEAGGQGEESMRRVAETIINRGAVRNLSFGDVVRQPSQYTGYSAPGPLAVEAQRSQQMRAAAQRAWELALQPGDPTNGADHYYNPEVVNPGWQRDMLPRGEYGGHAYYASRPIPPNDLAAAVATQLDVARPTRDVRLPTPRPPSPSDQIARLFSGTAANAGAARQPQLANSLGDYVARQQASTMLTQPRQIDRVVAGAEQGQNPLLGRVLADYVSPRQSTAQNGVSASTQRSLADMFSRQAPAVPMGAQQSYVGQDRSRTAPARTVAQMPVGSAQSFVGQDRTTTPSRTNDIGQMPAFGDLAMMFDTTPRASSSVNDRKAQDRLTPNAAWGVPEAERLAAPKPPLQTPARSVPPPRPRPQPQGTITITQQQANPAYQRMQERIAAGELELRGISPGGAAMSRDARARFEASQAAVNALRQQLANTQRTIPVQVTKPAPQQRPALSLGRPVSAPSSPPPASFQGSSTGRTYTEGQRVQMGRDTLITGADGAFRNERTGQRLPGSSLRDMISERNINGRDRNSGGVGGVQPSGTIW